tara:strand:- start:1073 stop:1867 length:795 start_codon:yes stop_codon:yes gene_type:complete
MSISFDDIPFEVLLNFIMPHISIKEVGALTMVNPLWRDMCNDQEVWKILYLRTVPAKVIDTSVHIGPRWDRDPRVPSWCAGYQPYCRAIDKELMCSRRLLSFGSGATCIPKDLKNSLKTWREVRTDGGWSSEFLAVPNTHGRYGPLRDTKQYIDYIHKEWREYNKAKGLSTVNLCQCPEHYALETLQMPGSCRNYKSFKKITLKKLGTSTKHAVKRADKKVARERKEYLKVLAIFEKTKAKYESANQDLQQKKSLCEKISTAIE